MKIDLTTDQLIKVIRTIIPSRLLVTSKPAQVLLKENILLRNRNEREYIEYYVTFKLHDGRDQKHRVNFWQYHQLRAGTEGDLKLQGGMYRGFQVMN